MDKLRFYEACRAVESEHIRSGIGTLSEKTTHAVLKNYFEPFSDAHEQKIGNFVADAVGENGIIEIQTGHFSRLRTKLEEFLKYCHVTVVYPVDAEKYIICFDPDTGEVSSKRKSPLKGNIYTVFEELECITDYLTHPNFSLCIMLMETNEYRIPPEKAPAHLNKKRRRNSYSKYDKIPSALIDEVHIDCLSDWLAFLPEGLPDEFTTADMALLGMKRPTAQLVMNVFYKAGIAQRVGKKGNSYIYTVK